MDAILSGLDTRILTEAQWKNSILKDDFRRSTDIGDDEGFIDIGAGRKTIAFTVDYGFYKSYHVTTNLPSGAVNGSVGGYLDLAREFVRNEIEQADAEMLRTKGSN